MLYIRENHSKNSDSFLQQKQELGEQQKPEIDLLSISTQNEGVSLECALTGGFKFFESVVCGCVYFLCVWMWSRCSPKKDE